MSSTIYGILGIQDRDTTVDTIGQESIYEGINELLARYNSDMATMAGTFIETDTTNHQESYKTPGGGMMQEADELTTPGAIKLSGEYTVAYDLRDARDQVAADDVTMAYMTLQELQAHITTVTTRHRNWVRHHILRHLLNKTNETFFDSKKGGGAGDLTIRRLANTDGTTYAPVIGASAGADDNHYLASGYTAANISDTNNPLVTIRDEIEEHFGTGELVAFVNNAQREQLSALTDFVEVTPMNVNPGDATATVMGLPAGVPGRLIGTSNDIWVVEWRHIPANYILAVDLMQAAPLKRRLDRPTNIMGRGNLDLVAEEERFPLKKSFWRDRHGYGVGNRLNGVAMELTTDATYDTPAAYA